MGLDYKEFSTVATKKEFKSIIGTMCEMKKSNQTLLVKIINVWILSRKCMKSYQARK